jgi:hypothetical protein
MSFETESHRIWLHFKELLDSYKRFCVLTVGDDNHRPKNHLMCHQICRASVHGNPWSYTLFADEALNNTLKAVLRNVSQLSFEPMAYFKLKAAMQHAQKRARR